MEYLVILNRELFREYRIKKFPKNKLINRELFDIII